MRYLYYSKYAAAFLGAAAVLIAAWATIAPAQELPPLVRCEAAPATAFRPDRNAITTDSAEADVASLKSDALKALIQEIKTLKGQVRTVTGEERVQIQAQIKSKQKDAQQAAKDRKTAIIAALQSKKPGSTLASLSKAERDELGGLTSNCIEQPVVLSGSLVVRHADGLNETSAFEYALQTSRGAFYSLYPVGDNVRELRPGTRVTVSGYQLDNLVYFNAAAKSGDSFLEAAAGSDQPDVLPRSGDVRILMIPVVHGNPAAAPSSAVMSDLKEQLKQYYKETSYNKVNVLADIAPSVVNSSYPLPTNRNSPACDPFLTGADTIRKLESSVNFRNYHGILMVNVVDSNTCQYSGAAYVGNLDIAASSGSPYHLAVATINFPSPKLAGVAFHEVGHTFGQYHASRHRCNLGKNADQYDPNQFDLGRYPTATCIHIEYGDLYDAMGSASFAGTYNVPHRVENNWLNESEGSLKTVTQSGRYTLLPVNSQLPGLKGLKIPFASDNSLYVEYRQPIGYDSKLSDIKQGAAQSAVYTVEEDSDVFAGALLHSYSWGSSALNTSVFDANHKKGEEKFILPSRAVVLPGETFRHPWTGAMVTVISASASGLVVDVDPGVPDFAPPDILVTSPAEGAKVQGALRISGKLLGSSPSAPLSAKVNILQSGGSSYQSIWSVPSAQGTVSTAGAFSATLDTRTLPDGPIQLTVLAADWAGNWATSRPVNVVVSNRTTDRTAPEVFVRFKSVAPHYTDSDYDGSAGAGYSVIYPHVWPEAVAFDKESIQKVELYLDDNPTPIAVNSTFYGKFWNDIDKVYEDAGSVASKEVMLSVGPHYFRAVAYDGAGNRSVSELLSTTVIEPADVIPPVINLIYPREGDVIRGSFVAKATATDDQDDDVPTCLVVEDKYPTLEEFIHCIELDSPEGSVLFAGFLANGSTRIGARACDEFLNCSTKSVNVTINNPTSESANALQLVNPGNGAIVNSNVPFGIHSRFSVGFSAFEIRLEDGTLLGSAPAPPVASTYFGLFVPNIIWDSSTVSDGTYRVFARGRRIDGSVIDSATISIRVDNSNIAANTAPTVNAGTDFVVSEGEAAELSADIIDDGKPNPPGAVSVKWSKAGGRGTVVFSDPNAANTSAMFSNTGTFSLKVEVSDGKLKDSDIVVVTVQSSEVVDTGVNAGPRVNGGLDIQLYRNDTAWLFGEHFDDGLPKPPGLVNLYWEKISGPSGGIFPLEAVGGTTQKIISGDLVQQSFTKDGLYVMRLHANDGALSASDDVNVFVLPRPAGVSYLPARIIKSVPSQVLNTARFPATIEFDNTYSALGDFAYVAFPDTVPSIQVAGPTGATVTFGPAKVKSKPWTYKITAPQEGTYVFRRDIPIEERSGGGALSVYTTLTVKNTKNKNMPPTVWAGGNTYASPGTPKALVAAAVDKDGPSPMTFTWSKLSGPGNVVFSSPGSLSTNATFSATGEYRLLFEASDGQFSGTDDIIVVVRGGNNPPTVNAGSDSTVLLPARGQLTGSATDDGQPNPPGRLSTEWSQILGPANANILTRTALSSQVIFNTVGTYVFRLTASDGESAVTDDVTVIVSTPTPPVVDAGPDFSTIRNVFVPLSGSASDDGLPNPLTVTWTKISGPGVVTFGDSHSVTSTARFSAAGTVVLRLTATDGGSTASDTVAVTVTNTAPATTSPSAAEQTQPPVAAIPKPQKSWLASLIEFLLGR